MGVLRRVCDDAPRPIREVNPEIPQWLEAIVLKLLAKNPADRFQTASEVADLLSQHLAHVQSPTLVPRPATVVVPLPPVRVQPAAALTPAWPEDGKSKDLHSTGNLYWATGSMSLAAFGLAISGRDDILFDWPRPLAAWFLVGGFLSLPVGLLILLARIGHRLASRAAGHSRLDCSRSCRSVFSSCSASR